MLRIIFAIFVRIVDHVGGALHMVSAFWCIVCLAFIHFRLARAFCRCVLELSLQEYEFCQFRPSLLALCVWKAAIEHLKTYDGNYFPPGLAFTKMQYELCLAEVHMFLDNFRQTYEDVSSVCTKYMNLYSSS